MRSLGDKISSTIVAQHAKVPCIPWSGTGVDKVLVGENGIVTVEDDVYAKGCVTSVAEGLEAAKKIGFPVMVKASEGGGGKGIRMVSQEEDFEARYKGCQRNPRLSHLHHEARWTGAASGSPAAG